MKTAIRKVLRNILFLLPSGSPERLYAAFFRGRLGSLVNPLIIWLLPREVRIPEGTIILNPKDPAISGAVALGTYEPFETQMFREAITPGMTVVDIGANIGYYTVLAAGHVGTEGRVIAFEPEPENYAILKKTIGANAFRNIDAYAVGVADKRGVLTLNLFESNKGRHSLVKDRSDARGFSASIQVPVTTLDSFLSEHGARRVDVIKMDIEGAESLALAGMQGTLKQARVLFLEFTPDSVRKAGHDPIFVLATLASNGFSLYEIDERTRSKKRIHDIAECVKAIRAGECANLFCVKEKSFT